MAVTRRGTDSSGRPILATDECWAAFDAACDVLGFVPTIVQGGHLQNAADASAATHAGDAFDLRIWDRTADEREQMTRVFRLHAFAYWERNETQGFDPHAHLVPGPWASPSPMALDQWRDYLDGHNGLKGHGPDDSWRPNPLVLTPPEDDMPFTEHQLRAIVRDETAKVVAAALDAPLNAKPGPKSDPRFRDWSVRKALKALLSSTGAVK